MFKSPFKSNKHIHFLLDFSNHWTCITVDTFYIPLPHSEFLGKSFFLDEMFYLE